MQTAQASFTIIVLPDTQHYTKRYPHIFEKQIEWITGKIDEMNIQAVIHLGDITNNNNRQEWEAASRALDILDESVPLILAAGNHDTGPAGKRGTIETPLLDELYPPERFHGSSWFGGVFESHSIKNAYYLFDAGGVSFIIMSLEFGPRDEVLEWAGNILARHQHRHAIVVTHCYLNYDGTRVDEHDAYNPHRYLNGGNDGEEIWNKLIRKHANISFVLSGHVGGDGTDRKTSRGDNGNVVHELLSNYQHRRSGGNGWLRIMEFMPDHDKVFVSTYSPYLNRYDTRNKNRFEIEFLME